MASFKDHSGRDWDVRVGFGSAQKVKDRLGVCLIDLSKEDRKSEASQGALNQIASLLESGNLEDIGKFWQVMYCLCEKQATERGVSDLEFAESMDMESLSDAVGALMEAVADFTLPRSKRERGQKIIESKREEIKQRMDKAVTLDGLDKPLDWTAWDSTNSAAKSPGPSAG